MNALPTRIGRAAAVRTRPLGDRLADVAQRPQVLDEGQRPCRRQHVDAAAHQELRRAIARDQCQRRFELGVKLVR